MVQVNGDHRKSEAKSLDGVDLNQGYQTKLR